MTYVITEACVDVKDGTCVNVCPQAVFKLEGGKAEPVNASECINCQTCVENCPQQAITVNEL